MGRRRVELKKIENKTYRQISFSKRKSGLVKKAYELSTLCDIDIVLILFSPAGKLFLYDGKKRFEEILQQYIDVPERQRGRLPNQERVKAMVAQLSLQRSIHLKEKAGSICQGSTEAELEARQKEIDFCTSQLEQVERQLMFFVGHSSLIKTLAQAGNHEEVLEEALRLLQMRKQALEAEQCSQQALEVRGSSMAGRSNFNFNPLPQCDQSFPSMDNGSSSYSFQPFSNEPQSFDGNFQSFLPLDMPSSSYSFQPSSDDPQSFDGNFQPFPPMDMPFSYGFQPLGNQLQFFDGNLQSLPPMDMTSSSYGFQAISFEPQSCDGNLEPPSTSLQEFPIDMDYIPNQGSEELDAYVPQLELGELANSPLPTPMDFTDEQALRITDAVQSKVGDSPFCAYGTCSHPECSNNFTF